MQDRAGPGQITSVNGVLVALVLYGLFVDNASGDPLVVEASRREARVPREGDPVSALPTTPCVSTTSPVLAVSSMSA